MYNNVFEVKLSSRGTYTAELIKLQRHLQERGANSRLTSNCGIKTKQDK